MSWTTFLQILLILNIALPVAVFFSIKFGTYAVFAGRRMFNLDCERPQHGKAKGS